MISVLSRQQRLNGNKSLYFLFFLVFFLASCSARRLSKKSSLDNQSPQVAINHDEAKEESRVEKKIETKAAGTQKIALLLPFKLDNINMESQRGIEASSLALDFYSGFKLALDSLAHHGSQISLEVLDSEDQPGKIDQYISNGSFKDVRLVVGPVYPEQILRLNAYSKQAPTTLFVSPLSPQPLSRFNNPHLIMVNSPLEIHLQRMAGFINEKYSAAHILLIRRSEADDKFIELIKPLLHNVEQITLTSSTKLALIKSKLDPSDQNILIVPSLDKAFWSKLLVYLVDLKSSTPLSLFAHPSFESLQVGNPILLQQLNLHFATTYYVDYSDPRVQDFVKLYKSIYFTAPPQNAFIGYDVGTYFGQLLGYDHPENELTQGNFQGLHNQFIFKNAQGIGYWNSSINMVHYEQGHLVVDK